MKKPEIFVDHIWQPPCDGHGWKCLLCGGLTEWLPTGPTPEGWSPTKFEPLSEGERAEARQRRGMRIGANGTVEFVR